MQPFDGIGGARRAPLAGRQAGEGEQPLTGFRGRAEVEVGAKILVHVLDVVTRNATQPHAEGLTFKLT
jgi:hypothetical protein